MADNNETGTGLKVDFGAALGSLDRLSLLAHDVHRIANAQERLVQIAEEARAERQAISDQLKAKFQAGFQAKPKDGPREPEARNDQASAL